MFKEPYDTKKPNNYSEYAKGFEGKKREVEAVENVMKNQSENDETADKKENRKSED